MDMDYIFSQFWVEHLEVLQVFDPKLGYLRGREVNCRVGANQEPKYTFSGPVPQRTVPVKSAKSEKNRNVK